jgi:hypothetical protein
MKPSYIILTETGERFDLNQANEFNPNEYEWHQGDNWVNSVGLYIEVNDLTESYCYRPDFDERFDDPEDGPTTATTLAFKAYDETGHLVCEDEGGCGIWL